MNRRSFLQGALGSLALPLLPSAWPRRAWAQAGGAGSGPPLRVIFFYVPNGMPMEAWTPSQTGAGFTLPPVLEPMGPWADRLTVVSGVSNAAAHDPGVAGDHARGTGSFLTCRPVLKDDAGTLHNGISFDQVLAPWLASEANGGSASPFPSLELGTEGGGSEGQCDSGYPCAYVRQVAWSDAATPMPKEVSPVSLYERLFAGADPSLTPELIARRRLMRGHILDHVHDETAALQERLGYADRAKLEQYLTSIEAFESQLEFLESSGQCAPGPKPEPPDHLPAHVASLTDLMALALQCDLTRVITFMMGNAGSDRVHGYLGMSDGHHYLGQHQGDADKIAALEVIATWEVERLAALCARLDAIPEPHPAAAGGSSVLDHTVIVFSSEIADGNSHSHFGLPVAVVAPPAASSPLPQPLVTGSHLSFSGEESIADLYLALAHAFGMEDPPASFGIDGTGPLAGLLAG